jgi:hypothetical protein
MNASRLVDDCRIGNDWQIAAFLHDGTNDGIGKSPH